MKIRFSMRALLVAIGLCATALGILYWIPKSKAVDSDGSCTAYYRGLGFTGEPGYLGNNWYRIVVNEGSEGYWTVDVRGRGYNSYHGYFGTGALREEGMCLVDWSFLDVWADRHDLLWGRFYDPEGHLLSEVVDRTGKQMLCDSSGKPRWELDLVDGKYAHVRMWHPNGQLACENNYRDGRDHGSYTSYYDNGQVKCRGENKEGEKSGTWTYYAIDGTVESQITYDTACD